MTNTEKYATWVEGNPSKIAELRLKQLMELDELCMRCNMGDTMLCSGYRLDGTIDGRVELSQCHKLEENQEQEDWIRRATESNIGKKKITSIQQLGTTPHYPIDVEQTATGFRMVGSSNYPETARFPYSTATTDCVKQHMLNFVDCGFQPRYVFTIQLYRDEEILDNDVLFVDYKLLEVMHRMIVEPDWVHIDAVDYQGSARIRQTMLKCLRLRLDELKMTTVSYTSLEPKTDLEDDIYGEISKWQLKKSL